MFSTFFLNVIFLVKMKLFSKITNDKKINKKISTTKQDTIMLLSFTPIYFYLILTYTNIMSQYMFSI